MFREPIHDRVVLRGVEQLEFLGEGMLEYARDSPLGGQRQSRATMTRVTDQCIRSTVAAWLAPFPGAALSAADSDRGCAVVSWARSGGMVLTGHSDGPPLTSLAAPYGAMEELCATFDRLTGVAEPTDPAIAISGRAALRGLSRAGRVSAGGATRLLRCADGWCAVTLGRDDDIEMVPAILGREVDNPWRGMVDEAASDGAHQLAEHIQQFGVAAGALASSPRGEVLPWMTSRIAEPGVGSGLAGLAVVDLSSLWAGPLCARLLGRAGATVIKVESARRPDGARSGNRHFFDWLHGGHHSVAVDFTSAEGRSALADLIEMADVVIEASRPRALRNLGLAVEQLVHKRGRIWVSITGYGRARPEWVAFGDDAAVAGGLVGWSGGEPVFCADAVADPLTGFCAAVAVAASARGGGGHLIDLSMRDVSAAFSRVTLPNHGEHHVRRATGGWQVGCPATGERQTVLPPRPPGPATPAAALGSDTVRVLRAVRAGGSLVG